MKANKIAIIGQTGWTGRAIVAAYIQAGVPIRILHRAESDISRLPVTSDVETVQIDWNDVESFRPALDGIDVFISALGHDAALQQIDLIPFILESGVKLFIPTDLALPYTEEERESVKIPRDKEVVEKALTREGVPYVTILAGNFAEFALGTPALGVDLARNRLVLTSNARNQSLYLCTVPYVAAAFVAMFAFTPPSELKGRTIGLNEFTATGQQILDVMKLNTIAAARPQVAEVDVRDADDAIEGGHPMALAYLVRKKWGEGTHNVGQDLFDVPHYEKASLESFIEQGAGEYAYDSFLKNVDCKRFLDSYFT